MPGKVNEMSKEKTTEERVKILQEKSRQKKDEKNRNLADIAKHEERTRAAIAAAEAEVKSTETTGTMEEYMRAAADLEAKKNFLKVLERRKEINAQPTAGEKAELEAMKEAAEQIQKENLRALVDELKPISKKISELFAKADRECTAAREACAAYGEAVNAAGHVVGSSMPSVIMPLSGFVLAAKRFEDLAAKPDTFRDLVGVDFEK